MAPRSLAADHLALEKRADSARLLRMARPTARMARASRRRPRRIVLDVDDTFDAVHGEQ